MDKNTFYRGRNKASLSLINGNSLVDDLNCLARELQVSIPSAPPIEISKVTRDAACEISEIRKELHHPADSPLSELVGFCHGLILAIDLAKEKGVSFHDKGL